MLGIHVISTSTYFKKNPAATAYRQDLFELYNTIISAAQWKKENGRINLVTDTKGYQYYKDIGLLPLWDDVIVAIPDDLEGINPLMFWAAGKLFALREVSAPVAMIDVDFIVWKKLHLSDKIVAAHEEHITPEVYPDFSFFHLSPDYSFPSAWRRDLLPLNTAFVYFPDESFKQYYVSRSLEFMKSAIDSDDYLCHMVFAEQRLLSLCINELSQEYEVLMDKDSLFMPQSDFTHLWGAKQVMRQDENLRNDFIHRSKKRIITDFPEYQYLFDKLDKLG